MPPRILPPEWIEPRPLRHAEALVYRLLGEQLSDDWTIIHDMAWIGSRRDARTPFVQVDFLLCHPEHGVIALEVKGGTIRRRNAAWYQETAGGELIPMKIAPQQQAQEAAFKVYRKLRDISGGQFPAGSVVHAVCFPNCVVTADVLDATLEREIVLDARDIRDLPKALRRVREYWKTRGVLFAHTSRLDEQWIETIRETFARDIDLRALLGPLLAQEKRQIAQLSDEQANAFFATRFQNRLAIHGCAGSGKTLLAQLLARRFALAGKTVLLCCYNRPLHDYLSQMTQDVRDMVTVRTVDAHFSSLASCFGQLAGDADSLAHQLAQRMPRALPGGWERYDVIIVDEGQDFDAAWWPIFEHCLQPHISARFYVFYDDNQRIYRRKPRLPARMDEMMLSINFRSTQALHAEVVPFYFSQSGTLPLAIGPKGDAPLFQVYDAHSRAQLWPALRTLLRRLLESDVAPDDIVVLTPCAESETGLRAVERQLNLSHVPRPGAVLWDTIYRFKGLERPIVIVVELDGTSAGRQAIDQLLYVAYSRASHRLYVLYDGDLPEAHIRATARTRRQTSKALTDGLNDAQMKAVTDMLGRALVWAGAGSGKTRVLTQRIVYLLEVCGIDPQQIVAVTFTNKAAREMAQRIRDQVTQEVADLLTIKTFHSLCYDILRDEIRRLPGRTFAGRTAEFEVLDEPAAQRLCARVARAPLQPRKLRRYIAAMKTDGISPSELEPFSELDELYLQGYIAYEEQLRETNRLDFDDLLLLTRWLFVEHPETCSRRHRKHLALLIDEFQDTNSVQFAIMCAIHDGPADTLPDPFPRSLFVVGDPQQSIYGFRGGNYRLFDALAERYPDIQRHELTINYRSTRQIISTALAIAEPRFTGVAQLPLTAANEQDGPEVDLLELEAVISEADAIAERIARAIAFGTPPKQIAVLMRVIRGQSAATATLRALEGAFNARSIPYVLIGIQSFYHNPVVLGLIAYLRATAQPRNDEHLRDVLVTFAGQVDDGVVDLLVAARQERGYTSLWGLLTTTSWSEEGSEQREVVALPSLSVPQIGPVRYGEIARVLRTLIQLARQFEQAPDLHEFVTAIRITAGFDLIFKKEHALDDYEALFRVLADYLTEGAEQGRDLLDLLNQLLLLDEPPLDDCAGDGGKVQVMTIHKSKGLEFDTVFVPGLEEGTLPSGRAGTTDEQLEEGRVCYVALTRARQTLVLTMVPIRELGRERQQSRYLRAIQEASGRRLVCPALPVATTPRRPAGPLKIAWRQGLRRLPRLVELTIDLAEDAQQFAEAPATIVIDAAQQLTEPDALARLEQMLEQLPGAYPVEILLDDPDEGPQRVSTGQRICGDERVLRLLRAANGLPVWRETLHLGGG